MHSLRDAVTLGVVVGGIIESDVMLLAELLELSAGDLAPVVQYEASRIPVVCQVLPQCVCNMSGLFSFVGDEPKKTTIVIDDRESTSETVRTGYHICEVNTYSFLRSRHRREFLPFLLQP